MVFDFDNSSLGMYVSIVLSSIGAKNPGKVNDYVAICTVNLFPWVFPKTVVFICCVCRTKKDVFMRCGL